MPTEKQVAAYHKAYEEHAYPLNPKSLKKVGGQMGSNPGGVYETPDGKRFYVKQGKSLNHVKNELTAAALYAMTGAPTLNYRTVEGGGSVATEMEKLDKNNVNKFSPAEIKQAQEDFVTHAWLSNWDAVGLGGDNLGTVQGKVIPLDLGGALSYRAQGAPKGAVFGNMVGEIDTLRDPKINPDNAKIFKPMTAEQLKESASKVTELKDADVWTTVMVRGGGEELAKKMIARKHDIAKRFDLATDEFQESQHPRDPEGKFTTGSGGGGSFIQDKERARGAFVEARHDCSGIA